MLRLFTDIYGSVRENGNGRLRSACIAILGVLIVPSLKIDAELPEQDSKIEEANRRSERIDDWSELVED